MTVAKACTICGDTLSSKSNLNRHVRQKHPSRKKKINTIHKVQKHESQNNIEILNKTLWQLLMLLLNNKYLTIVHQEQCEQKYYFNHGRNLQIIFSLS